MFLFTSLQLMQMQSCFQKMSHFYESFVYHNSLEQFCNTTNLMFVVTFKIETFVKWSWNLHNSRKTNCICCCCCSISYYWSKHCYMICIRNVQSHPCRNKDKMSMELKQCHVCKLENLTCHCWYLDTFILPPRLCSLMDVTNIMQCCKSLTLEVLVTTIDALGHF